MLSALPTEGALLQELQKHVIMIAPGTACRKTPGTISWPFNFFVFHVSPGDAILAVAAAGDYQLFYFLYVLTTMNICAVVAFTWMNYCSSTKWITICAVVAFTWMITWMIHCSFCEVKDGTSPVWFPIETMVCNIIVVLCGDTQPFEWTTV